MNMRSLIPSVWGETSAADPFRQLQREIDRLFAGFSSPLAAQGGASGFLSPRVDMAETDAAMEITVELPGVDARDVEITLSDDVLTIKGEKKAERDEAKKGYHLVERSYGAFRRSLPLPAGTDPDKIVAKFDNGVLSVTFPKPAQPASQAKKIPLAA